MTRGLGGHSPANVAYFLKGTDFPATKRDLIAQARYNGAEPEVMEVLFDLPDDEYFSMADVMVGYGEADRAPPRGRRRFGVRPLEYEPEEGGYYGRRMGGRRMEERGEEFEGRRLQRSERWRTGRGWRD